MYFALARTSTVLVYISLILSVFKSQYAHYNKKVDRLRADSVNELELEHKITAFCKSYLATQSV